MLKNFYIINFKKNFFPFLFLFFTICLVLFSNSNLEACRNGLKLWSNSVVPSLLPFFIATELLSHTEIIDILGKKLNFIMQPLFNVRGEGCFALIMGIISGYPIGAKIASNFRQTGTCSKEECERLLSFTNNSGPLFIIGTVGISMFGNTTIGILLLITHILASLTVGICFRFYKKDVDVSYKNLNTSKNLSIYKNEINFKNLGAILR